MTNYTTDTQVRPLESIGAQTLMETQLDKPEEIVVGLFSTQETLILAAPPKTGKSILAMNLGIAVSTGTDFLGHKTKRSGVAYLALEDTPTRLQNRLWATVDECTDDLRLIVNAEKLGSGLIDQLEKDHLLYPRTKLYIVDTFGVVRGSGNDYSYSSDYGDVRAFKEFSDTNKVCLILVHHLRKQESDNDQFNEVSGTTGFTGAADGIFIMKKKKRSSRDCILTGCSRDIEYVGLDLAREGLRWHCVAEHTEAEAIDLKIPQPVKDVARFVRSQEEEWIGTITQLIAAAGIRNVTPGALGKYLAQCTDWLATKGVNYTTARTRDARMCILGPSETTKKTAIIEEEKALE